MVGYKQYCMTTLRNIDLGTFLHYHMKVRTENLNSWLIALLETHRELMQTKRIRVFLGIDENA